MRPTSRSFRKRICLHSTSPKLQLVFFARHSQWIECAVLLRAVDLPAYCNFVISMLPLLFARSSVQAPFPIVPLRTSEPIVPIEVIGNSDEILPNEVRADTLYPAPAGTRTRRCENEVLSEMFLQEFEAYAATSIAPF